jgi:hypothetical protein
MDEVGEIWKDLVKRLCGPNEEVPNIMGNSLKHAKSSGARSEKSRSVSLKRYKLGYRLNSLAIVEEN